MSGLLRGLKSLVERGSGEAAAILAQVLAHLAADDGDAQVTAPLYCAPAYDQPVATVSRVASL